MRPLGVVPADPPAHGGLPSGPWKAQTQRCQVHPKPNILKRVPKKDRDAFRKDLDAVFYAKSESKARRALSELKVRWARACPTAVEILERAFHTCYFYTLQAA